MKYDLIIIGGGPGGYVAAERAGAKGLKTLLIEKAHLGGVCLNEGCIPTKTLLYASKLYAQAGHSEGYGVTASGVKFSLTTAMEHKTKVMTTLRNGIGMLMKKAKVTVIEAEAKLLPNKTVSAGGQTYQADNILIATGSSPIVPPIPGANQDFVLTSTGILNIDKLPKSLAIIGGGVIGMEFASFFSNVGVEVTIIEMLPEIIPMMDPEIAKLLRQEMKAVSFNLGCKVESMGDHTITFSKDGKSETINTDLVLMSIGRSPNLKGLGLEEAGIGFERQGITVDKHMRTNVPGIYAIGDVTGRSLLAHSASRMGEVAVDNITGGTDHMRYQAIPGVVYTYPEVASVGLTETQAKAKGLNVKTAKAPMTISGRFLAENQGKRGICKIVVDADSKLLLGAHMLGSTCSEMIYGACAMIENEMRVQDIQQIVFPHPTVGEVLKDVTHYL